MSHNFSDSVILITNKDIKNKSFGTGFVIHRDEEATYLLTCAHVVRDVGGVNELCERCELWAGGEEATIIPSKGSDFDLAVLRVEGLYDKPLLKLCAAGAENKPFIINGYYDFDDKNTRLGRDISGKLGQQTELPSQNGSQKINAWDLKIEGEYTLQPGYSGSPVIDKENSYVLGVVSHRIGEGEKGLAISIDALAKVWTEMPNNLIFYQNAENITIMDNKSNDSLAHKFRQDKIKRIQKKIDILQNEYDFLTEDIEVVNQALTRPHTALEGQRLNRQKQDIHDKWQKVEQQLETLKQELKLI